MKRITKLRKVLATLLTIAAMAAGQTAWAEEVTYTVTGSTSGNNVSMTISASSNSVPYVKNWTYGTDDYIQLFLNLNFSLEISNPDKAMTISNGLFLSSGNTTFTFRNTTSSYHVMRVRLYMDTRIVFDQFNAEYAFTHVFPTSLSFNQIGSSEI